MSRQRSRQMSRQRSIQDERVLPVESWGDLQKYLITNHRARQKGLKKYEKEFLARYKKRQKTKSKKKVSIPLRQIEDLGRLSFREHIIVKREEYLAERNDYEQMYLHRCTKKQNGKPKRSSSITFDHDLISGRLNLREHVDKKQKELQAERGEYEKKYLSRYKKSETKLKKSKPLKEYNEDLGRLDFREHVVTRREMLQAERDEYEKKYVARYRSSQKQSDRKKKAELKKSESYLHIPEEPKQDIKKERKLYEMEYVSRFKKIQKTKLKIAALEQKLRLSQLELDEPKQDIKKERKDYEKEYLAQYKKQQKSKPKKGHQNS